MKIPWTPPLEFIRKYEIPGNCFAFLYSGMRMGFTGRYSYLAFNPIKEIVDNDFNEFDSELTNNEPQLANAWFGYLGYGLKNTLEKLPPDPKPIIDMPDLWMVRYSTVLVFDNEAKEIECYSTHIPDLILKRVQHDNIIKINSLSSNMTKKEYLEKVNIIKEAIARGDLYQANLTRKFFCEIENSEPQDIFIKLCKASPAPYSALMKFDNSYVISSSPEQFLHIDKERNITTRPIKGTSTKPGLKESDKDRAENLMIVDLMRNDLSRSCEIGSIEAKSLYDITSYKTLNHMSSTITGKKRSDTSTLDVIRNCFPPGSMTGAPKIKAIELCTSLEPNARGVYSGVLGWLGGDGSAELSVVIRTIIIQDNILEFQVGGGIVADSNPETEWQETITKSVGILNALGISQEWLEKL